MSSRNSPEQLRARLELRRSGAAGRHNDRRTRRARTRGAATARALTEQEVMMHGTFTTLDGGKVRYQGRFRYILVTYDLHDGKTSTVQRSDREETLRARFNRDRYRWLGVNWTLIDTVTRTQTRL